MHVDRRMSPSSARERSPRALLGFVRDAVIAALFGAGPVADAFLVAFQFVNVVRRLLTEGALNAALVPPGCACARPSGEAAAAAFAGRVLGTVSAGADRGALAVALGLADAAGDLGAGAGLCRTADAAARGRDARLMLPYLAFAGPVAVMMALLNAKAASR